MRNCMNQDLITIVLPIYNVKKYLDRCMESIINQTYSNLEILMIDDGSTDGCDFLCDSWAEKDNRVRVIHKINAGLGMARNTGIDNATGKYIVFFDSDDYVESNAIELCYKMAIKDGSELVTFGHSLIASDGRVKSVVVPHSECLTYRNDDVRSIVLKNLLLQSENAPDITNMWMSAWSNFYSMDLIRRCNWRFVSERHIISEDVYSLLQLYSFANSISIIEKSLYNYCENGASLTHVFRKDRFDKINIFYKETLKEAECLGVAEDIIKNIAYPYIANIIAMLKMLVNSDMDFISKNAELKRICYSETLVSAIKKIDLSKENRGRRLLLKQILGKHVLMIMILVKINLLIKK